MREQLHMRSELSSREITLDWAYFLSGKPPVFICSKGGMTYKVSDGSKPSVLVLLEKTHQQRVGGLRLPRRQQQRLVKDPIVHFSDITAVERRLNRRDVYLKNRKYTITP